MSISLEPQWVSVEYLGARAQHDYKHHAMDVGVDEAGLTYGVIWETK